MCTISVVNVFLHECQRRPLISSSDRGIDLPASKSSMRACLASVTSSPMHGGVAANDPLPSLAQPRNPWVAQLPPWTFKRMSAKTKSQRSFSGLTPSQDAAHGLGPLLVFPAFARSPRIAFSPMTRHHSTLERAVVARSLWRTEACVQRRSFPRTSLCSTFLDSSKTAFSR